MDRKQKVAFIKIGNFSHINDSVLQLLTTNFPNFDIEVIDISDLISKKDVLTLIFCVKQYGKDILLGRKTISGTFLRTPYAFNKIKLAIHNRLANEKYAFTFQTQSIFDSSVIGTPHFVYTDHTHLANLNYPGFNRQNLFDKSWIECEKKIYQNATLTFTMSSNISKSIIEDYSCSPEQVSCVYCGANVQVTEDEILEKKFFSYKNILFVGTDWQRKGGPVLVEAFRTVLDTYPDATLTIVGCTPKLNIPNCNVVGRLPLSEVKKYFEQASVFCLPTTLEPFGIVFLEAMAHKLPIIASNIGAIPDFILEGKNGYLVEPNNSWQLSQQIINLIGSWEKCKTFGEYGHKLFWDRYTWEKTGVRIRENIKQFLA
jgi:glycosyltransferase involved in cell wall biosynthesis